MTQEEKELLLIDICARLPYDVLCKTDEGVLPLKDVYIDGAVGNEGQLRLSNCKYGGIYQSLDKVKPYLRPMSSMTEEEILELYKITYTTWYSSSLYYKNEEWITFRDSIQNNALCFESCIWLSDVNKVIDWLNAYHFDYRGLISMGLALEAPEGMYT